MLKTLHLKVIVTEDRQLKIDLPDEVPVGEHEILFQIAMPTEVDDPITKEEMQSYLTPATGVEIVTMLKEMGTTGWEHITDSVAWVEELREKRRKTW